MPRDPSDALDDALLLDVSRGMIASFKRENIVASLYLCLLKPCNHGNDANRTKHDRSNDAQPKLVITEHNKKV